MRILRNLPILVFALTLTSYCTAQEKIFETDVVTVYSSNLTDRPRGSTVSQVFNIGKDGCSAILKSGEEYEYLVYNEKLEVSERFPLNEGVKALMKSENGNSSHGSVFLGGAMFHLQSITNIGERTNQLILYKI